MPAEYAALVLIGGFGWMNPEAERVLPIVKDAMDKGIVVGAICNAASWMAKQGLLNNIKHTGNGIDQLKYGVATTIPTRLVTKRGSRN